MPLMRSQKDILNDVLGVGVARVRSAAAARAPTAGPAAARARPASSPPARRRPGHARGRAGSNRTRNRRLHGRARRDRSRRRFRPSGRWNTRQCHVIGRQLSHFYLIRTLGTGGMGVVYEAQDTRLPRSVAIKVIKEDLSRNVDAVRRFKREARLAASLNHPNICTILEIGDEGPQSFIAMELLEGTSLKSRLLGGPVPIGEIVDIARQVADALGAAHAQGIIHRDITPANIFLTASGSGEAAGFRAGETLPDRRRRRRDRRAHQRRGGGRERFTTCRPSSWPNRRRLTTGATSLPSGRCSTRWRPALVRSTSCRGTRSARPSRRNHTCRCASWRRTTPCGSNASSTPCSPSGATIGMRRPAISAPSWTSLHTTLNAAPHEPSPRSDRCRWRCCHLTWWAHPMRASSHCGTASRWTSAAV